MVTQPPRRTKIVATIGPASGTAEGVRALVESGMDAARLNLSHGSREEHAERARLVRGVQEAIGRPLALIADLQGPKLRIGHLPAPVTLTRGDEIAVVGEESSRDSELPVLPAVIGEVLQPGHEVLIDDGLVRLRQKRIIIGALDHGKTVITATQMLESMIHQPEPTRAEASDVANAILDGTSAVMLSGETAVGEFPIEAVTTMTRIARAVEPSLGYRHQLPEAGEEPTVGQAMSNGACDLAETLRAAAILVPTFSGRTASAVARLRPRRPVLGLTHHEYAWRQMAIEWGVIPLRIPECADVEELWERSLDAARESGVVEPGDRVVITAGTAGNIAGPPYVSKGETV